MAPVTPAGQGGGPAGINKQIAYRENKEARA
jgi:hypothetical protein